MIEIAGMWAYFGSIRVNPSIYIPWELLRSGGIGLHWILRSFNRKSTY
jgi:hypothetical protein